MLRRLAVPGGIILLCLALSAITRAEESDFENFREVNVLQAPDETHSCHIDGKKCIVDIAVLPDNSAVIALLSGKHDTAALATWDLKGNAVPLDVPLPDGLTPREIVPHPLERKFFLLCSVSEGQGNGTIAVCDIDKKTTTEIYTDTTPLSNLVVSTSKFVDQFRLYFARHSGTKAETVTITEDGKRFYPVISEAQGYQADWMEGRPNTAKSPHAVPLLFYSQGDILFYIDGHDGLRALPYNDDNWGDSYVPAVAKSLQPSDRFEFSPNGLYMIVWSEKDRKLRIRDRSWNDGQLVDLKTSPAGRVVFTADGKGVIFATREQGLTYLPLRLPLYDVKNAWMFVLNDDDARLLNDNGGLLRTTGYTQMYGFYDTELYRHDPLPERPYLVTTDPFYEILEAAFSGIFYTNEKAVAIPRLKAFLAAANQTLAEKKDPADRFWTQLFASAAKALNGTYDTSELVRVRQAEGGGYSPLLQADISYGEFKPRGYYEQAPEMQNYFRAVQLLIMARPTTEQWIHLSHYGDIITSLKEWNDSYRPFVAPPRQMLPGMKPERLPYVKHPFSKMALFTRAWGVDNEILDSVVFHEEWPDAEQVVDVNGEPRLLPDLRELAYVFGSGISGRLLEKDDLYRRYPVLQSVHQDLIRRWSSYSDGAGGIYDKWLMMVATQVAGKKPDWPWLTQDLWESKQLMTGLAGWTNLRHATILVNERSAAECGEGGFEFIEHQPPRGAVEPFPEAFDALITVFGELQQICQSLPRRVRDPNDSDDENAELALRDGIIKHLGNTISNLQAFKVIAEKERKNEPLTSREYELIRYCGRSMEHDFLLFKSIMTTDFGLAEPLPMMKTADVYGDSSTGILHAAVGKPMEWDLVVPCFGKRQVTRGIVYSFHQFTAASPTSDSEWRSMLTGRPLPGWLEPYVSSRELTCPVQAFFASPQ